MKNQEKIPRSIEAHEQAFVLDGTLIAIGLVLAICLCIKYWHGPKCYSLSSFSYCKEYLYVRNIFIMACPRGTKKVASARQRHPENLASLSTEVLRLRLQAANLPITGSKAEMISRLKAAIQPRPAQPPSSGCVQKRTAKATAKSTKATAIRPCRADPTNADRVLDDASDRSSSVGSVDGFEEDDVDLASFGLSAPQSVPADSQPGLFSDAQMAAIQDTVRLSLEQATNSRSCPSTEPFSSPPPPITLTPSPRRQGAATPMGLHCPMDRNLEDKILRGFDAAKTV